MEETKSKTARPETTSDVSQQKSYADHHANQSNPTSQAYRTTANNRSNQMNSNNRAYHSSRGRK